jgi:hypothetical protein
MEFGQHQVSRKSWTVGHGSGRNHVAFTRIWKLCMLGYHQLIPIIGRHSLHRDYSLCCVPRILEGDSPSRSDEHRYRALPRVPLSMERVFADQHPL